MDAMRMLRPQPLTSLRTMDPIDRVFTAFHKLCLGSLALMGLGLSLRLQADEKLPNRYLQTNLVSDVSGLALVTDPALVNPWGLSASATSPWWVSDNGTGLSTLYRGTGAIVPLVVAIPNLPSVTDPSAPTGTVFNGASTDFLVAPGKSSRFLFATEGGTIIGWNSGTLAVQMVDNSATAVYKGLAIAQSGGANYLYAANFKSGRIDVFDRNFAPVSFSPWAFRDMELPRGYAPFNVQAIGDQLFVTYALKAPGSIDELHGPGRGFVDVYSTNGDLRKRLEHGAWLNAPWGVALAPADFGLFSGRILVGQFGSGKIIAYDAVSGRYRGMVKGFDHRPLRIEGLWALSFGNGAAAGPANVLYFTAGIDDEAHGLLGSLMPMPPSPDDDNDSDD
jgi:uncharacterized protein (TIGR03118 family)